MSQLSKVLRGADGGMLQFWCPGCDCAHGIRHGDGSGPRPQWQWNGDIEKPTFKPSILVTGVANLNDEQHARIMRGEKFDPVPMVCHSFVTDGQIQFLGDCTHPLAGQTVPLGDWG